MMETLGLYLAKSAVLMAMFLGAYHLFLKRETFFKSNRWYLLLGLVTSLSLPLVTFKKVVWIEPAVVQAVPASTLQRVSLSEVDVPAIAYGTPAPETVAEPTFEINWTLVLLAIYALVALALFVQFTRDFLALSRLLKGKSIQKRSGYKFVDVPENVAPFSYFDYIVYNSSMFSHDELINILEHEKVHSIQRHTLDVLLSRIVCIAFWWNPVAWFYKKAIVQNLEFIADCEAAKKIPDIKAYQITLLKITTHERCVPITNHFFQSLIKKRIVMLNKNQSSKWNSYKYLLIVPALAVFFLSFQVKEIAQEKQSGALFLNGAQQGVEVVVNKNTTDAELKQHTESLKKDGIKLKFSKVKRNASGEIVAIKAEFKDEFGKKGTTMVSGDKAIEPIRFFKTGNTVGFGRAGSPYLAKGLSITRTNGSPAVFSLNRNSDDLNSVVLNEPADFVLDSADEHKIVVKTIRNGRKKVIINGKVISDVAISGEDDDSDEEVAGDVVIKTVNRPNGTTMLVNGEKVFDSSDAEQWAAYGLNEADKALAKIDFDAVREDARRAISDAKRERTNDLRIVKGHKLQRERDGERADLEKMKADIEKARADLDRTRAEIEKMRAEMRKERASGKSKK